MSLRVWLPLTKDLRQQGLDNVTVTNNGATFNSAGKLGGCYSFNGSSYITVQDVVLQNIWSYSCWLYSDVSSRSWEVVMACNINGGDADMQLGLYTRPGGNNIQNTANGQYNASIPMTYGQWNHFVGTFDGANLKTYLNGVLVNTKAITNAKLDRPKLTIGARCRGSSYDCYFQGLLNDIRIYDHCLSPMEVKELAKGLVLHYPLSDNSIQQLNNCYTNPTFNSSSTSAGWSHWGSSGHQGTYGQNTNSNYIYRANQSYSHWVADGIDATKNYLVYQSPAFEGGQRSLQCICKEENSLPINESIVYPAWNARNGGAISNQWTSITSLGNGFYYCKCENIQQSGSDDLVGFYVRPGYKVYFSEAYLENDRTVCSDIFYPTDIIYDCSGFCNNGTKTGTFTCSGDTPKYSMSTTFSGSQYIIEDTEIETTDSTIAMWIKTSLSANAFILDCRNSSGAGKQPIYQYPNGSIQSGGASQYVTTNNGLLVANTWIHLALVQSGSSLLVYKNGSLFQTLSCTNSPIIKPTIGARYTLTGLLPSGSLSDVRIYATALSASDVKSLYQNSAYIDSSGNIYGKIHD